MRWWGRNRTKRKTRVADLTLLEVEDRLSRMFAASSFGCTTRLMFARQDLHVVRLDVDAYAFRAVDYSASAVASPRPWRVGSYVELLQHLRSLGEVHEEVE